MLPPCPARSPRAADGRQQLVRNFQKKKAAGEVDPYGDLTDGIHPHWLEVRGWRRRLQLLEGCCLGVEQLIVMCKLARW